MRDFLLAVYVEARHRAAVILIAAIALLFCWALGGCTARRPAAVSGTAAATRAAAAQQEQVRDAAREIREQARTLRDAGSTTSRVRTLADRIDYKATWLLDQ